MTTDIHNVYLLDPLSKKNYKICGCKFGLENVGKQALMKRGQYGGNTSGSDF